MSVASAARDHLRLTRPYAWLWFDLLPASVLLLLLDTPLPAKTVGVWLLAIVLADAGGSTLNDVCDVETDRASLEASRRNRPVAAGRVSVRAASFQAAALLVAAPLLLSTVSRGSALAVTAAIAVGLAYNVPPLRLAGRPRMSILVWPLVGGLAYASAALLTGRVATTAALGYLVSVGIFLVGGEILAKDLRDHRNDQASGRRTAVGRLGVRRAAGVAAVGGSCGALGLLTLVWTLPGMAVPGQVAASVSLLAWAALALPAAHRLRSDPQQWDARRLHRTFIAAYLAFNASLLAGSLL